MAVRNTMGTLITRVRQLINDTSATQIFSDQEIQDVLDECRQDVTNHQLNPRPTFVGGDIQYLDYYAKLGHWEDDTVFKQYLTKVVTPTVFEPIVGHWQFAATTLPPIFITGKTYDIYRAAADLLERWAAKWAMSYNITASGQNLQRGQVTTALLNLAQKLRLQQRPVTVNVTRPDIAGPGQQDALSLAPGAIDYIASGDGR